MASAKKAAGKKTAAKKSAGRKYSSAASKSVEREMKAMKEGKLESGSGEKVTNPKQAIAIGLSEARRAGAKVPPPPKKLVKAAAKKNAREETRCKEDLCVLELLVGRGRRGRGRWSGRGCGRCGSRGGTFACGRRCSGGGVSCSGRGLG